mmetsp:Transcript_29081/g.86880  ORF Transcript_29081/g.86880 Transcript_29081/m.86880 type:complete len:162 (-) Transcript_29081:1621-2106(-)
MFRVLVTGGGPPYAAAEFTSALCDPGPGLLVLDEAHRLKEPRSQLYRAVARVRTPRRILATGYPVQNRLDEYWALVDFARPGVLGAYERFRTFFERPIVEYLDAAACGAVPGASAAALAMRRAFVLRRELEDVVQMAASHARSRYGISPLGATAWPRSSRW